MRIAKYLELCTRGNVSQTRRLVPTRTFATKPVTPTTSGPPSKDDQDLAKQAQDAEKKLKSTKTQKELDDELMKKLAGISGDGGESGIEYEDGKPVAMKRGVKNNMFRLI